MFRIRVRTALIAVAFCALPLMMVANIRERDRESSRRWASYQSALAERDAALAREHARRAREARHLAAEFRKRAETETDLDGLLFFSGRALELDQEAAREAARAAMAAPAP